MKLLFYTYFVFLLLPESANVESYEIVTFTPKPHLHRITKAPKTTLKPKTKKPSCHPFNPLCMPCKVTVNVLRTAFDRIIFFHEAVENVCFAILDRHIICDAAIRVTKFYLDHTPTLRVCKRFLLCTNKGLFDWWWTAEDIKNMSKENATIYQILNTPVEQYKKHKNYEKIMDKLNSYSSQFDEMNDEELPDDFLSNLAHFIIAIESASKYLLENNSTITL